MADALLMLDELDLLPVDGEEDPDGLGFWFEALGEDSDFGTPEQAVAEIASQLLDGEVTALGKAGNREATIRVRVDGVDSEALAEGEKLLTLVCDRAGLKALAFLNPDEMAAVTVFDVQLATLALAFDDLDERRGERIYTLTLVCKPWPRSDGKVEVDAEVAAGSQPPEPPADVVLTDAASTAGFSGAVNAPGEQLTTEAATPSLKSTYGPNWSTDGSSVWFVNAGREAWLNYLMPAVDRTRKFVKVEALVAFRRARTGTWYSREGEVGFRIGGRPVTPARLWRDRDTGQVTAWLPVTTEGALTIYAKSAHADTQAPGMARAVIAVESITRTVGTPALDTQKVRHRVLAVEGSKPAEASVLVAGYDSAGAWAALGRWTLIYTSPSTGADFNPSLSRYRLSGPARTPNAALLSGGFSIMATGSGDADLYRIPLADLVPGTYQILAHVATQTGDVGNHRIHWAATMLPNPVSSWPQQFGSALVHLPDMQADTWDLVSLGEVTLPLADIDVAQSFMHNRLQVWCPDGAARLDTLLLLNVSTGQVTLVDTRPGAPHPVVGVRVDAPTSERPQQTVWLDYLNGTQVYTVAAGERVKGQGLHRYPAGPVSVFTVTTGCDYSLVTASYYPRWNSFAATLPAEVQ